MWHKELCTGRSYQNEQTNKNDQTKAKTKQKICTLSTEDVRHPFSYMVTLMYHRIQTATQQELSQVDPQEVPG